MNLKKIILISGILVLTAGLVIPQNAARLSDAASIVQKSRDRVQAETTSTRSRMVIRARNGNTTERVIDQYSKKDAQGNSRTVIVFQSPASIAGTRFLTRENANRANDQWIFQPSLGSRARRLVASEGSSSFLGTDLSNDDISSMDRRADLDTHKILREEKYEGHDCYVIESTPKDSGYQYSKMITWISVDDFLNYKIELYDRRGNQVKLLEVLEYKEVQGIMSMSIMRMTTLAAGTSTTIHADIIRYNDTIPEVVFTTEFLETGRAR